MRVSSGQKFATWRTLRLYVGHFSFDVPDGWAELEAVNDGNFTLLVKAESADEALGKYRDLIEKLDDSFEGFGAVGNVYLDSVSEVKELPPEGALSHFTDGPPYRRRCPGWSPSTARPLAGRRPRMSKGRTAG